MKKSEQFMLKHKKHFQSNAFKDSILKRIVDYFKKDDGEIYKFPKQLLFNDFYHHKKITNLLKQECLNREILYRQCIFIYHFDDGSTIRELLSQPPLFDMYLLRDGAIGVRYFPS